MTYFGQKILPSVRKLEDFEKMLKSPYEYGVLLEMHVSRLKAVYEMAHRYDKKMFLHMDLVQGLKNDEYATEYVCQELKPYGVISTKASVILKARQKKVKTMQRMFLLDSSSLEKSYQLMERTQPDYIEVLPGLMPKYIQEVKEKTGRLVFAGGLIDTVEEVEQAIEAGASSITTSNKDLWRHFEPRS
ncbi:glycerol-3-phosphate responsive antiterminator GlpP [Exiguobacterium sp. Leaf187]|uniref:Glycerol uptake operon antiterminator regulatory protein n=2 Tax=Exiguobacterium TaxID=33986 RepID=A0A0V8GFV9_9BACL|nr:MULTISPECIES: glycerol-3-phosphate responsive antiterminator [Exiguobacterium]AHA29021.1 glycerol-3-phosphate responsive antiterminator [Exiguobacterium sp. MH3]AOS99870.1 glycerol-3-phosphate responsive antiterminator GlpP [Exiguobacterium sp. U13-1]EZP62061.1 Glycerol-3-phosphate responsive antiterminator [Exiguobacterium sp. RIT341]KNH37296.1 glycerol-3-phosphate responsive antiterminator GlpP [Exiguobacterium acetylicum]KOP28470.1 glycerol-3-phosphate responsive antiterminator GlpP [Exi